MSNKNLNTEKLNTSESEKFPVDCIVGLPPLQLNEIYNADSFKLIERVPAKTVDLILEDMPYNTTACEWDVKIDLQLYWETRLRILKPTGAIVLTASQPFTSMLVMSNKERFAFACVWNKEFGANFVQAKRQPIKTHEDVLFFTVDGKQPTYNPQMAHRRKPIYKGGNKQAKAIPISRTQNAELFEKTRKEYDAKFPESIITFNVRDGRGEHPTQKPVGLFEYLIRTYSNEGDLVFDGFGGSGTTAVACHKSKRNFIVIEKEQKYFDLATRRLADERTQLSLL